QRLRNMARTVIQTVGVETGGSNVQFAVNPKNGDVLVIEMNPRVSRSSALASKATGFPIAKIAALLAVGYTLDEIPNDITRVTPASFEPSIDYCVVKIPRWNFEKFPGADVTLGPQMKSIGEVMAIGRTFPEALNKAIRGLDIGVNGFSRELLKAGTSANSAALRMPTVQRLYDVARRVRSGEAVDTQFDPWFIAQLIELLDLEEALSEHTLESLPVDLLREVKRHGFSDKQIADLLNDKMTRWHAAESARHLRDDKMTASREFILSSAALSSARHRVISSDIRQHRLKHNIRPVFYRVDTCAAEFEAFTPYLYSTYESHDEAEPTDRRKVIILGGGPNRIGQGIEFDYCCVQACFALKDLGFETIMINCNPETVSTDYDTADRLYFEPLTLEDVLNVIDEEQPEGVIVQFGGQTPINLTRGLAEASVPIWGTSPDSIDLAEDRVRFGQLLRDLDIPHPEWGTAQSFEAARRVAKRIGYPVLVRPSYVLGGRAMEIAYDEASLAHFLAEAAAASPDGPVLIDHYLEDAFEIDVDAIGDGERIVIAGVMQHIEEAGVHSGDSAC
ncbi:MAG TPA: carbamoyl-phosphate synthase large subunit, partial [Anaerolineae bacterium]|nr:carbamoyl-phosphate synthase large subunit [Anaerolineae bacterium]